MTSLTKFCPRCGETKLLCDFGKDSSRYDGLKYCCKPCAVRRNLAYQADYYRSRRCDRIINMARARARKIGLPYDLDEHRPKLRERFERGVCEMTDIPFVLSARGRHPLAPSLDRIEPVKGYVYGNVRVVLDIMNVAMNAWGEAVLRDVMGQWVRKEETGCQDSI